MDNSGNTLKKSRVKWKIVPFVNRNNLELTVVSRDIYLCGYVSREERSYVVAGMEKRK
jgi:hypothetical protein